MLHSNCVRFNNSTLPLILFPVDGGFSNWLEWSDCSATCGGGSRARSRKCDNPVPQYQGKNCVGLSLETEDCNEEECPSWCFSLILDISLLLFYFYNISIDNNRILSANLVLISKFYTESKTTRASWATAICSL